MGVCRNNRSDGRPIPLHFPPQNILLKIEWRKFNLLLCVYIFFSTAGPFKDLLLSVKACIEAVSIWKCDVPWKKGARGREADARRGISAHRCDGAAVGEGQTVRKSPAPMTRSLQLQRLSVTYGFYFEFQGPTWM